MDRYYSELISLLDKMYEVNQYCSTTTKNTTKTTKNVNLNTRVSDDKNGVTVNVWLPGFKKSNVAIDVDGNILTIKSVKTEKDSCFFFEFDNEYNIPDKVDKQAITAELEDGVLKLNLPYAKKTSVGKITIM